MDFAGTPGDAGHKGESDEHVLSLENPCLIKKTNRLFIINCLKKLIFPSPFAGSPGIPGLPGPPGQTPAVISVFQQYLKIRISLLLLLNERFSCYLSTRSAGFPWGGRAAWLQR